MIDNEIKNPIPTNIITGFLGVGKTTAIQKLIAKKPQKERWAVLVNEFGEVGIDSNLFEGGTEDQNGVTSKSSAWGMYVLCKWIANTNGSEHIARKI